MQLMTKQRIHQEIPPSDRCSLQGETNSSAEVGGGAALVVVWLGSTVGGACADTSERSAGQVRRKHSSYEREALR